MTPDNKTTKTKSFNSRTREGATRSTLRNLIGLVVSIHAPVRVRLSSSTATI